MSADWWEAEEAPVAESVALPAVQEETEVELQLPPTPGKITAAWVRKQCEPEVWKTPNLVLTPQMIAFQANLRMKGLTKRPIMARSGLSVHRWTKWQTKAHEGREPYVTWQLCMDIAVSNIEEEAIENIRQAGGEDWKASKWMLEQYNKEEYTPSAKNQTVNVHGDINDNRQQSVNFLNNAQAVEVAQLLQQYGALTDPNEEIEEAEVVEDE